MVYDWNKIEKNLPERVKQARIEANMTQQELAYALGLTGESSWQKVSRIENGRYPELTLDRMIRICIALNKPMEYFIGKPCILSNKKEG
jgi:transcriptional regulator with XRE-family HTH domain